MQSQKIATLLDATGLTVPSKRLCTHSMNGRTSATAGGSGGGGGGGLSARLEKELERTLREFVRMKTVSSDPSLREECFRGAKYLAHLLESLGTIFQHKSCFCQAQELPICNYSFASTSTEDGGTQHSLRLQHFVCVTVVQKGLQGHAAVGCHALCIFRKS